MVEPEANFSGSLSYYIFKLLYISTRFFPRMEKATKHHSVTEVNAVVYFSLCSRPVHLRCHYTCSVKPVFITSFSIRELVHLAFHLYKGYYQEVADGRKELNGM